MAPSLLTLPPELRNMIYEYLLPAGSAETQTFRFSFSAAEEVPVVLQVNKQMRNETLGLYYGTSHFDVVLHWRGIWQLAQWANALSQEAVNHLLRNKQVTIRVIFDEFHPDYEKMKQHVGNWSISLGSGRRSWWATAEGSRKERMAVDRMMDTENARRVALKDGRTTTEGREKPVRFTAYPPKWGEGRDEGRKLLRTEMMRIVDRVLKVFEA